MHGVRILLAALLGGLAVFGWGAVSHMVLHVGEMGVDPLPNEAAIVGAMQLSISERGFYVFPAYDPTDRSKEAEEAWAAKYEAGPRGVVVYDPSGDKAMSPKMLGTELGGCILAALLAAVVIAHVRAALVTRIALVMMMGVFAWASVEVSYWNWWRFPSEYLLGALVDQGVGWLVGGVVIGCMMRPRAGAETAAG